MKTTTPLFLLLALLSLPSCSSTRTRTEDQAPRAMRGTSLNVNAHLGYRRVQGSGWEGFKDQTVGGIAADFTPRRWPLGFEAGVFGSSATHDQNGSDVEQGITDGFVGVRKNLRLGRSPVWLFAGAGAAAVSAEKERKRAGTSFREIDDDASAAWYGHAGAYWRIARRFNLGVDARTLQNSELEVFRDKTSDADNWQVTVFFGWGW